MRIEPLGVRLLLIEPLGAVAVADRAVRSEAAVDRAVTSGGPSRIDPIRAGGGGPSRYGSTRYEWSRCGSTRYGSTRYEARTLRIDPIRTRGQRGSTRYEQAGPAGERSSHPAVAPESVPGGHPGGGPGSRLSRPGGGGARRRGGRKRFARDGRGRLVSSRLPTHGFRFSAVGPSG